MSTAHWMRQILVVGFVSGLSFSAMALSGGVAQRDITPPPGSTMYGYSARGATVSEGVHDPLFAKVLVLRDATTHVVLIALDLGGIPGAVMNNVREAVSRDAGLEHLLFAVSHSHSAANFQRNFPSEAAPWSQDVERLLIEAILEANASVAPVQIGVGQGLVEEGHNRRVVKEDGTVEMLWSNRDRIPTHPVDHSVSVIRVMHRENEALATIVNFTCHPVVLGPDNLQISADFPGAMARHVEAQSGGLCLFLQGACGDINPFGDKTPLDEGAFEEVERMGRALADEVIRVSSGITPLEREIPLSFHSERVTLGPRRVGRDPERTLEAEINTVTIGDAIALATFPGEFFVEHGLSLKERSKFDHTLFVGYCNGALGYFPTINACVEGGYGADIGSVVEAGAGEHLVNRALINLYTQAGMLR